MITMYDSITVSNIPANAQAVAGYVNGNWPTWSQVCARFPNALKVSIAVNASADADCLDIENGDAVNSDAPAWHHRQVARGISRPILYTMQSNLGALVAVMNAAGIPRSAYRLWSAHYNGNHICAPNTCNAAVVADATQWYSDSSVDESACGDSFFTPVHSAGPTPTAHLEDDMGFITSDGTSSQFWVIGGVKHPITNQATWQALQQAGVHEVQIPVAALAALPVGTAIN